MKALLLSMVGVVGLLVIPTAGASPARADDVDRAIHRHMMHRMMHHEMHREMRHRMMRHEMRRRMIRHEMRHDD